LGPEFSGRGSETRVAKEARKGNSRRGNPLGYPVIETGAGRGLQCGLSGNPASPYGNVATARLKGNRRRGDGRCVPGENLLDLSHNIKPAGCHSSAIFFLPLQSMRGSGLGNNKSAVTLKHVLMVAAMTFLLAIGFALVSEILTKRMHSLTLSFIFLLFIIIIHIAFDIVGIAATAASESPFHAQSAKRVTGAQEGYLLIRHADRVANFANDVIGDITATVSGALGIAIALQLVLLRPGLPDLELNVLITSAIAAVSVAGKAVGKRYAIDNANQVVFAAGRFLARWEHLTGMRIFRKQRGRKANRT